MVPDPFLTTTCTYFSNGKRGKPPTAYAGVAAGACCDCLKMLADQAGRSGVGGVSGGGEDDVNLYAMAELEGVYHRKCYSKIFP